MRIDTTWTLCLWGHMKDSHTCYYVMAGLEKAAGYLGMNVVWADDQNIPERDWAHTLFFAIEGDDKPAKMPVRDDCFYILHNSELEHLKVLHLTNQRLNFQVLTNDSPNLGDKLNDWTYFSMEDRTLYSPWATNLLPTEIDQYKTPLEHSQAVHWIGTMGSGEFGNFEELDRFRNECERNRIAFHHWTRVSDERHIQLIRGSLMAPAIVGSWQNRVGYIPCRIFKNISYGQMGSTNSAAVNKLFGDRLVFTEDTAELFYRDLAFSRDDNRIAMMDYVKHNHTYAERLRYMIHLSNEILGAR